MTDLLAGLLSVFSNMLFLLFVAAFMALDAVGFSSRLARARRQRADAVGALDTFVHGTRSYLLVTTVFGGIVAADDDATPDRASEAPTDRIASAADGQGPPSSATVAKLD